MGHEYIMAGTESSVKQVLIINAFFPLIFQTLMLYYRKGVQKSLVNDHSFTTDYITQTKMNTAFNTNSSDSILFAELGIMNCTTLHGHKEHSCGRSKHEVLMNSLVHEGLTRTQHWGLSKKYKNMIPHNQY